MEQQFIDEEEAQVVTTTTFLNEKSFKKKYRIE